MTEPRYTAEQAFDFSKLPDNDAGRAIKGFFKWLETAELALPTLDTKTGKIKDTVTGQEILRDIINKRANAVGEFNMLMEVARTERPDLLPVLNQIKPHIQEKCPINLFNAPGALSTRNTANTAHIQNFKMFPAAINVNEQYLRQGLYQGVDGNLHPVSVEGVMANELFHVLTASPDENASALLENAVLSQLGAVERDPERQEMHRDNKVREITPLIKDTAKGGEKTDLKNAETRPSKDTGETVIPDGTTVPAPPLEVQADKNRER